MAMKVEEKTCVIAAPPAATFARRDLFTRWAAWAARATGGRLGFLTALALVLVWLISGPIFDYSENWQLVINTTTSVVTFLMVFLIQNAQNRESKAIHLKLDELILCVRAARNEMIGIEHLTEEQLDFLGARYSKIAENHFHELQKAIERAEAVRHENGTAAEMPVHDMHSA